jgi:hypothetical protein
MESRKPQRKPRLKIRKPFNVVRQPPMSQWRLRKETMEKGLTSKSLLNPDQRPLGDPRVGGHRAPTKGDPSPKSSASPANKVSAATYVRKAGSSSLAKKLLKGLGKIAGRGRTSSPAGFAIGAANDRLRQQLSKVAPPRLAAKAPSRRPSPGAKEARAAYRRRSPHARGGR